MLTFQLLKGGAIVSEWVNVANIGQYELVIPASLKPGKDYSIDVVSNAQLVGRSQVFPIKRKIPLAVKFIPLAAAGIVLLILPKNHAKLEAAPAPPAPPS